MQKIDKEKLSEFTNELAEFQVEASKTASIEVYDRFTITILEDHIVDLYQLSIDAAHYGLQLLCERMRDNIRDHAITGTNISSDEFVLMAEWKSLVKTYLVNNDNERVIAALVTNLSKPGWTYPLLPENNSEVTSVLLGKVDVESGNAKPENAPTEYMTSNDASQELEIGSKEFDDFMQDSTSSLADVFESMYEDDSDDDSSVARLFNDDEKSLAACFEEQDESNFVIDSEEVSEGKASVLDVIATEVDGKSAQATDIEVEEELVNGSLAVDAILAEQNQVDRIEVSEEELEAIDEPEANSPNDEMDHHEDPNNDLVVTDIDAEPSVDSIEVSPEELATIDESVVDDLFVSDVDIGESDESIQALQQKEATVVNSLADDLFVADVDDNESGYNEEFDNDLAAAESETIIVSSQEQVEEFVEVSNSFVNQLLTEPELEVISDEGYQETIEQDVKKAEEIADRQIEQEVIYIEDSPKKERKSRSIIEAYVDVIASKQQSSEKKTNKPKELEQELIEQPSEVVEVQELESVESILTKYPQWSEDQKELLSLILSEVHDVVGQQDEVLQVLHQDEVDEEAVLEMVTLYVEQIERMGSAAEMVGLDALNKLCELIGFHFGDLARSSTGMIVSSEERIKKWPYVVYEYLKDIQNEASQQDAIDYISDDDWARTIREDIKNDLKQAFVHSTIHVERNEEDQRITEASDKDIDITVPDDVQAELLDGLLQELPHQAEEFSSAIQELVKQDYLSQLEVTQRIAHTIKGAANTVGIVGVATLTHHLEDILQALMKAQAKPSKGLYQALMDASDCLEQMTEYLLGRGNQPDDSVQTLQVILDWANYIDEFGPPLDDSDESATQIKVQESVGHTNKNSNNSNKDKAKSGQDASLRVSANMIDNLINQSGESIIATSQMHENVTKLISNMRDIKKNKDSVYSLSQHLEHLIDIQGTTDKFSTDQENEKFDPLELDQYNELHTYSRRLIEATADSVELVKDLEERLFALESVIVDQTRSQKDNQFAMLRTRMMPVESVVARLKRGVRQSAKISEKSVELEVLGVEILLDSKILNNLLDPLMHMLRNAVDHGVESDEVRKTNGKPVPSIIQLSFSQVGERLEIFCQDDGKGLNLEEIKARAIEKELIDDEQELSDKEIHQLIMQHGFSTRDEVTQLSGRGVGMDVVYSSIKELNGSIDISSKLNKGMKVELSLPVSLLTAHALLIPTITGTMAVSTNGIEEILQVDKQDLKETKQGLTLHIEDEEYPAVHLEQLLKMRLTSESQSQTSYSALLVDDFAGQKKVVLVNEIQSVRDIIIKPFSRYLPKVEGLIGATVLGNGDIASVVDVGDLLSKQSNIIGKLNIESVGELEEIHQASVLVVEDSISTRRLLAEFMQDLNYKVYTAKDGVEAIEVMRDHQPTILLTDLEMPRMNGLELTSYVRSHDETKDIPIIMLTSRTTEKHRQEAKSIGVNEYLTKPFVEDILLEKVQLLSKSK